VMQSTEIVLKWRVTDLVIYTGIPLKRPTANPRSQLSSLFTLL